MSLLFQDLISAVLAHRLESRIHSLELQKGTQRFLQESCKNRERLASTLRKLSAQAAARSQRKGIGRFLMRLIPGLRRLEQGQEDLLKTLIKWNDSEGKELESVLKLGAFQQTPAAITKELSESTKPRRVLLDLRGWKEGGINGGLQTYVAWLLDYLTKNHRAEFAILALATPENARAVLALLGDDDAVFTEGSDDVSLPASEHRTAVVSTTLSIQRLAEILGVETVYAPLGSLPFTDGNFHRVVLVADMLHAELPGCLDEEIVERRHGCLQEVVAHASLIQCISQSSKERLEHHYPAAIGKTFYTYLPVQARLPANRGAGAALESSISASYFFYPANFWPHKNHLGLIVGYHQYVRKQGDSAWDLVLTGADYQGGRERVRETAARLGIADRIMFTGYVSDDELGKIWQGAGALVFPSLHEGFGIPLIEAMHHHIPILTSPAYSLLEIAGPAALYFNPMKPDQIAARMVELTESPALAETLRTRGRERLKKFSDAGEATLVVDALMGLHPKRPMERLREVCGCPI